MFCGGPSLRDFVWDDIDIIYKSPQVSYPESATYFLIGEDHERFSVRDHHSGIVDDIVTPGSILVVEGVSSMVEVTGQDRENYFRLLQISEYAQKMIKTIIGWDRQNHMIEAREPVYVCEYDKQSGHSSIFTDFESIFPLGDRLSLLKEVESYEKEFPDEFKPFVNEVIKEGNEKYSEEIAETLPMRTTSMSRTLEIIEEQRLQGKIKGKIILMSGKRHLEELAGNEDPRFSLAPLYDVVKKLPSVVLASQYIDQPRNLADELWF